jgi:pyruvate ferredoxin oxidoreductase gamma subunit
LGVSPLARTPAIGIREKPDWSALAVICGLAVIRGDRAMFWVRVQGTDGGEVLATAELLARAAAAEGKQAVASAVPMVVPAGAVCAIDGSSASAAAGPEPAADALIIQDPDALGSVDVFARLSPEAYLLVNSAGGFGDLGLSQRIDQFCRDRVLILPEAHLDLGPHDGLVRSASMAGGFAALSQVVTLDSVVTAIRDLMPGSVIEPCLAAAATAYDFVRTEKAALAAA